MLDIGWSELLVIGAVALIVVGPKDLPRMLRLAGQMIGKVRRMASEFQGQVNEAIREAELDDVKKSVDDLKSYNPANMIRNEIDQALSPIKQVGSDIDSEMARIEAGVHDPAALPSGASATAESLGLPEIAEPVPPALPEPTSFPEPTPLPEPVMASSGPTPAIETPAISAPPHPADAEERSKSA